MQLIRAAVLALLLQCAGTLAFIGTSRPLRLAQHAARGDGRRAAPSLSTIERPTSTDGALPAAASVGPSSGAAATRESGEEGSAAAAGSPEETVYPWGSAQELMLDVLRGGHVAGAREVAVAPHLALQVGTTKAGGLAESVLWESDRFERIRCTSFRMGTGAQVLNTLWLPRAGVDAPALGADFLSFAGGRKCMVAIDTTPLDHDDDAARARWAAPYAALRAAHPELHGEISTKIYDTTEYFSDAMLFGRFDGLAPAAAAALPAWEAYLAAYIAQVDGAATGTAHNGEAARDRYAQYQADHDPAHGLFSRAFGKPWADDMVYEFLFPGAVKHAPGASDAGHAVQPSAAAAAAGAGVAGPAAR